MRTVINIDSARRIFRLALTGVLLAGVVIMPGRARADGAGGAGGGASYFTTRSILAEFFPRSERVTYRTVVMDSGLKDRISRRLGYEPAAPRYTIFVATTGANIDGYAVIDDQLGEHQPITFATKLSVRAVVERVEIVAYREPRGDEVRDIRFRSQFVGKTARDPLRLNHDIDAVTGATISSGAMAVAVRRAAVLVEEAMVGHTTVATAASSSPSGPAAH